VRRLALTAAVSFSLLAAVASSSVVKAADREGPKDATQWSNKMRALYKTLADLLTDVTSDKRYYDPANRSRIDKEAGKLADLAHDLSKKGMVSVDSDPTIQIVAEMLGTATRRAVVELKRSNRAYARTILRAVPGYCIACHTRNGTGPQFAELKIEPGNSSMSAVERGEFFAASRQFDRAQGEFMRVIKDPKVAQSNRADWERAIRYSLSIAVRVKQDPVLAEEIVDTLLKPSNVTPVFVREDAKVWKTSIQEWKEERPRRLNTEEGLHAEALRLMSKAREIQKFPMDRTADVLYLRASAAAHDLLQTAPQGPLAGDGLLLAGLSYEILSPLGTEDLHDVYYEACVRKVPNTATAEMCYRRFEQSVFMAFGGNNGFDVPEDILAKLGQLKLMAAPAPAVKN
jgi:hypothetical protein